MSDESQYLVIGSHGFQGAAVARLLQERGHRVRGFAKSGISSAPGAPDIPTFMGDLADLDDVRAAFEGVTHVSVVLPLVYERELIATFARNVATAAKDAGVGRIVYNTNTPIPRENTSYAAYETRRVAEEILGSAGLPLVVLRPPVYLDNLFSPWNGPPLVNEGVLAYPLPADLRVAWLSHADLATATVAALHRDGIEGRAIAIGGPDVVTGEELATAFGEALGRDVSYLSLDVGRFEAGLKEVIGEPAAAGVSGIYKWAHQSPDPDLFVVEPAEVERMLGVTLTPITQWVSAQRWDVWATAQV
jgi:uncharacterized protein YbjT (DUF2867 family)